MKLLVPINLLVGTLDVVIPVLVVSEVPGETKDTRHKELVTDASEKPLVVRRLRIPPLAPIKAYCRYVISGETLESIGAVASNGRLLIGKILSIRYPYA